MRVLAAIRIFTAIISCIFLCGCSPETPTYFFWELTKGTQKIYVLGVMHELPANYAVVPAYVKKAYAESSVVYVESVRYGSSPSRPTNDNSANISFSSEEKETIELQIRRLINDKLIYEKDADTIRKSSIARLNRVFSPIISARVENVPKLNHLRHSGSTLGIDNALGQLALRDKKKLRGLENPDSYFTAWSENCNSSEHYLRGLSSMMAATYDDDYIVAVNAQIRQLFIGDLPAYIETTNKLISKYAYLQLENDCAGIPRTLEWAKRWESTFKNTPTALVIVGANHVSIEPSLTTLLEKQGYVARRITE